MIITAVSTVAGLGVAVATIGASVAPTPAFADTGYSNYTCTNSGGPSVVVPIDVTGTISPATTVAGDAFNLDNYQVVVDITPAQATTLHSEGVTSMSGTAAIPVEATNATPSSIPISQGWGPVTINPGVQTFIDIPSSPLTVGPFTPVNDAGPPVLSTGSLPTTVTVNGSINSSSVCSPPSLSPTIDTASLNMSSTPSASSIAAGAPGGISDAATVVGSASLGSPSGSVSFYLCGPGASTCSTAGTPVGTVSLIPGADAASTATSAVVATPTTAGTWCFFAQYTGDSNYPGAQDGSPTECFTVTPPIPCAPSCSGTVSSSDSSVTVSGTSTTPGDLFLSVGPATVNCGPGFDSSQQFTTIQESNFTSSRDLTVTYRALHDSSLKHFGMCWQSFNGTFRDKAGASVTAGLLHKCKRSYPAPCIISARESGGSVVALLSVRPGDPRGHGGGPAPEITRVTPAVAPPGKIVTIKGLNLTKAKVKVGSVAAKAKAKATSITVTIPSGIPAGLVPITVTTPTGGSTVYRGFSTTATSVQ